jgi:NAD(P)-dependent dehydrogenase (short-subunit alcohol dehydrogenase family)
MPSTDWSESDIAEQSGRTVLVTGANSGLGLETSRALAERGARVLMACRNADKAEAARQGILDSAPAADVEVVPLDLASLESVAAAAARVGESEARLDLLVNNAGVMAIPRAATADGFEMQFGTNHLGHFALTGQLLPKLLATPGSRVVNVSSNGHRFGKLNFDNLMAERRYSRWRQYSMTKLANLAFTYELQSRLEHSGADVVAVAAHPGVAHTGLGDDSGYFLKIVGPLMAPMAQDAQGGALPILRAAVDPGVAGGDYFGPSGRGETKGPPVKVESNKASHDVAAATRLWKVSEDLTGIRYPF